MPLQPFFPRRTKKHSDLPGLQFMFSWIFRKTSLSTPRSKPTLRRRSLGDFEKITKHSSSTKVASKTNSSETRSTKTCVAQNGPVFTESLSAIPKSHSCRCTTIAMAYNELKIIAPSLHPWRPPTVVTTLAARSPYCALERECNEATRDSTLSNTPHFPKAVPLRDKKSTSQAASGNVGAAGGASAPLGHASVEDGFKATASRGDDRDLNSCVDDEVISSVLAKLEPVGNHATAPDAQR